jgi:hypothetical protein
MANLDESTIGVTLYVAPAGGGGNNNNSGLSPLQALASFKTGVDKAFDYLDQGIPTKLILMNGVHRPGARVVTPDAPSSNQINTLFVLEGQTKGGVTLDWVNVTAETGFRIAHPKSRVVIRNIIWANGQQPTVLNLEGNYPYIGNYNDYLVEHCEFTGCGTANVDGPAVGLGEVTRLTFRHNYVHDNFGVGFQTVCRQSVIEDCVFTRNELNSNGRAALFVWAADTVIRRVQCNDNNGRGFRNDIVGNNIFVQDSQFNNNRESGMKWEIASGPIYITNCEMINNGLGGDKKNGQGLYIETVYDLTVDNCVISDNRHAQISITSKDRTALWPSSNTFSGGGTGDLSGPPGSRFAYVYPMYGTQRTTIKNSYIGTGVRSNSYLFAKDTASTNWGQYETWYQDQFTGINNTYEHQLNFYPFEKKGSGSNTIPDSVRFFAGFTEWKTLTGTDTDSTFIGPDPNIFNPEAEGMVYTAVGATTNNADYSSASGGFMIAFLGNSVNDRIDFTARSIPAGTYNVQLRPRMYSTQGGIAQLRIDGVNQGAPVDFANTSGGNLPVIDLGSVTFPVSGNHTLSFLVTGKSATSTEYKIGIDRIDFLSPPPATPSNLVATPVSSSQINLAWSDNSNDESGFVIESSLDGVNGWTALVTTAANVTSFSDTGLDAETAYYYRVKAIKASVASAYSNIASATTTGNTIPQNFEAEALAYVTSGPSVTIDSDAGASGGQRVTFKGNSVGQSITYTANVSNPGVYNIKIYYKKLTSGGISQLSVDGVNVGTAYNTYAGTAQFADVTYAGVNIGTAGNHTFTFTVTGKASASTGYKISVDRIDLLP